MTCGYTKLPSINAEFDQRFQTLENKYVRSTRFEEISSGTSGAVTITGSQEIVLDDFGGGTDAVISTIEDGRPTFEHATDTSGQILAATLDAVGNWTLSGTPSSYPVAIIFRVREHFVDFDGKDPALIGSFDLEDHSVSVTGNDLQPGDLNTKIIGEAGKISTSVVNPGGNEQLQISIADDLLEDQVGLVLYDIDCDSSVFLGAVVYFQSNGILYNAKADTIDTANAVGVCVKKPTETTCDVRVSGVTDDLFTGLDVTKQYYLSDVNEGRITTTIPTDSGHVVYNLGQPMTDQKLIINKELVAIRG